MTPILSGCSEWVGMPPSSSQCLGRPSSITHTRPHCQAVISPKDPEDLKLDKESL
jgi:hypothetical protein